MPLVYNTPFPKPRFTLQTYASPMTTPRDVATDGNGNWVIVGADNSNASVHISNDRLNWTEGSFVGSPASVPPFGIVPLSVATDKAGNWILMTGDRERVYKSTDNGATWYRVVSPAPLTYSLDNVFYAPGAGAFFILGGSYLKSTDGGDTWVEFFALGPGHGLNGNYKTSAVSSTRAVVNGGNARDDYTDDGNTWFDAGMSGAGHYGGWYEPTVGIYALTNTIGEVSWSLTGGGSWNVEDIDISLTNDHKFIIFSPQDNKWITSNNITGNWYKSTDSTPVTWELQTEGFDGVSYALKGDADASHYVAVTIDSKIVTF